MQPIIFLYGLINLLWIKPQEQSVYSPYRGY